MRKFIWCCVEYARIDLIPTISSVLISLGALARHCKELTNLKISECPRITDRGVQLLAQECNRNLRALHVANCSRITDESVPYLVQYCPFLLKIDIRFVSPQEFSWIPRTWLFAVIPPSVHLESHKFSPLASSWHVWVSKDLMSRAHILMRWCPCPFSSSWTCRSAKRLSKLISIK